MNILTLPWCIICATLAQTSALVIAAFAAVRLILYSIYVMVTGKGKEDVIVKMERYIVIELMTCLPLVISFFMAYTSMQNLLALNHPWRCLFWPFKYTKATKRQATSIYEHYLELRRRGMLAQDETSFFSWSTKYKEIIWLSLFSVLPLERND